MNSHPLTQSKQMTVSFSWKKKLCFFFMVLSFFTLLFGGRWIAFGDEKPPTQNTALFKMFDGGYYTVESQAVLKLVNDDMGIVTIRQVSLIHQRMIDRCITSLPDDIGLFYLGAVRHYRPQKRRVISNGDDAFSLNWQVAQGEENRDLVFNFWISTKATNESVVDFKIDKKLFFINVNYIPDGKTVDTKLPQLGKKSVREVLLLIKPKQKKKK